MRRRKGFKMNGTCLTRKLPVAGFQVCDFFELKRRGRYKVCCRNCTHFAMESKDDKPTPIQQDS